MTRYLVGLGALVILGGCSARDVEPCSPAGYAAVDLVCLELIAPVVADACGDTPPGDCPEAIAAVGTCALVRAEQDRECR
jgi:hypothetical protein